MSKAFKSFDWGSVESFKRIFMNVKGIQMSNYSRRAMLFNFKLCFVHQLPMTKALQCIFRIIVVL